MDPNPLATERRQRRCIEAINRGDVQYGTPITVLSPSQHPHSFNTLFIYCQLLKETFLDTDYDAQTKGQLVDFCRREFEGNQATLRVIDEFERDYERHRPTWWYTRDCFVRHLLNEALRTDDIEVIRKFGFFIKDLHRQLEELHRTLPLANFTVYGGQGMPKGDFEKLQGNVSGFISFNSFLSTSTDEHRSLLFARSSLNDPDCNAVLFVIHVDLALSASLVGFLDDRLTYLSGENEYLWDMNTIFRIDAIEEKEIDLWQVNLILTTSDDPQLKQLTDYMRRDSSVSSGLQRLGNLMIDMGEWSKAKDIYGTLLREEADPFAIQQLGLIAHRMNDLDAALGHYRHALSVSTAPNDPELVTIHSNMGCVLNDKGCHTEALKQFERTLHLQRNMQTPNDLHIARTYNNIASVRDKQGHPKEALENAERALSILSECLPPTHPEIAASLSNIATFCEKYEQHSDAKDYYEKSLSLQESSLSSDNPALSRTTTVMKQTFQRIELGGKAWKQSFLGTMRVPVRTVKHLCCGDPRKERENKRLRFLAWTLLCIAVIAIAAVSSYPHFPWTLIYPVTSNTTCVTKWTQKGVTVAGGHNNGSAQNQLSFPQGLYVDDNQTILVVDSFNHRIVEWELGATTGRVVAGGNGGGNRTDQFNLPSAVIVDNETDSLIICDPLNRRVMRWPRHGGTNGTALIENIACTGLATDDQGFLYISDWKKQEVRRYRTGETDGKLVAGGNGLGDGRRQFAGPHYVFVDRDYSVYVADSNNHRVMKWGQNASRGMPVAGDAGIGGDLIHLAHPRGLLVDQLGTVYVAEYGNDRVSQWCNGRKQAVVSVGGNGPGNQAKQLNFPDGLALDRNGNLYVSDSRNHRVQRFSVKTS